MSLLDLDQLERSVTRIVTAIGSMQDWQNSPCTLQILALGLLSVDLSSGEFDALVRRMQDYARENPVLGYTTGEVYSHLYLAMSKEQAMREISPRTHEEGESAVTQSQWTAVA